MLEAAAPRMVGAVMLGVGLPTAVRTGGSLRAATTRDIEWDGESLEV